MLKVLSDKLYDDAFLLYFQKSLIKALSLWGNKMCMSDFDGNFCIHFDDVSMVEIFFKIIESTPSEII